MKQPRILKAEKRPFYAAHNLSEVIELAIELADVLDDITHPDDTLTLPRRIKAYLQLAALDCEMTIRQISNGNLERAK